MVASPRKDLTFLGIAGHTGFTLPTNGMEWSPPRGDLPNCCFPAWRNDGKPSQMLTVAAGHPIAAGLPKQWTLPATEMYAEPSPCSRTGSSDFQGNLF